MKGHAGRLVGTAEAPQKADRIAAAPKTSALCQDLPYQRQYLEESLPLNGLHSVVRLN